MKKIAVFILLVSTFTSFSQIKTDSIFSTKLNTFRTITVSVPKSYRPNSKKTYPVFIVLDGDYLFDIFNGTLTYGAYWDDLPEMIIVGVDQSETRTEDSFYDEETIVPEGTGSQFFEFIGGELLPYIEKKYPTSAFRMIAGHDVTAGFLNFFLYKDNPVFNAYISLAPELAPGMEVNIPSRLSTINKPILYYQCTSEGDLKEIKENCAVLDENIKSIENPQFKYTFEEIKMASHYSLVAYAIPNALYSFFKIYQPISKIEFQEKIVSLPSGYVDYLTTKYEAIDKIMGSKTTIRYSDFKAIEAAILKNKAYNEFEKLAELSKKMYPKSMLSEYHFALFYENTGDYKKAAKSYQNAFQLEEIGSLTKDMMLDRAEQLKMK
jgi:predicted alpha/beta superfamily hydrolase